MEVVQGFVVPFLEQKHLGFAIVSIVAHIFFCRQMSHAEKATHVALVYSFFIK